VEADAAEAEAAAKLARKLAGQAADGERASPGGGSAGFGHPHGQGWRSTTHRPLPCFVLPTVDRRRGAGSRTFSFALRQRRKRRALPLGLRQRQKRRRFS
jgi:hypothetical protein